MSTPYFNNQFHSFPKSNYINYTSLFRINSFGLLIDIIFIFAGLCDSVAVELREEDS